MTDNNKNKIGFTIKYVGDKKCLVMKLKDNGKVDIKQENDK